MSELRGLRNNNPLNIRLGANRWPGEVIGGDPAFRTFDTMHDGIREGARLLLEYATRFATENKVVCVANVIARWAPDTENDTASYAQDVAKRLCVSLTQPIDLRNPIILRQIVLAIAHHENGAAADRALTPDLLAAGVAAALA